MKLWSIFSFSKQPNKPQFSFCETITAGPETPWHIRELTSAGRKLGGGADTLSLCNKKVSWDLRVSLDPSIDRCCGVCKETFLSKSRN